MTTPTLLTNIQATIEPGPCSLFPNFTGVDDVALLALDVDGGDQEFIVGEVATGGTSNAFGTILAINGSAGDWGAGTGTATLVLGDVTGTFQNNEAVTGATAGAADASGTGTAGTAPGGVVSVKGNGILSITSAPDYAGSAQGKGLFTITLKNQYAGLLGVKGCVSSSATADDYEFMVVSETVATTKVIVIQMFKGGAEAAPQSTDKVFFELVLATSKMVPQSF